MVGHGESHATRAGKLKQVSDSDDDDQAQASESHATRVGKLEQVPGGALVINSSKTVKHSNSERSQAGQFVVSNTSLSSSNPEESQSGGTLVDLPTTFINHLSSPEKIREPENPDNQQSEMIPELTSEKPDENDGSVVSSSTNTEHTTSIVTSLTPFNLFNSHFFKVTNDVKMSENTDEPPQGSFQYEVESSYSKQHPQLYSEDMTEVIIIRKCSTSLFCQRHRSIDFIAGWVGMVDDILEITQFIDV